MRFLFKYVFLCFAHFIFAQQEDKVYNIHDHHATGALSDEAPMLMRLNMKLMPAFFSNTLGLEFEMPLNKSISLGMNALGKYGRFDNPKISKPVEYFNNGYRFEVVFKYYFKKEGPCKFYAQLFGGFSKLLYDNGNTRPYALNLRALNIAGDPRNVTEFVLPKPLTGGLGVGYQERIINQRWIANIMVGSQAGIDSAGELFFSVYLSPSIGYVF